MHFIRDAHSFMTLLFLLDKVRPLPSGYSPVILRLASSAAHNQGLSSSIPAPTQLPPSHQGWVPSLPLGWLGTYCQQPVRSNYSEIIVDIFACLFVVPLCCVFLIPVVL